MAKTPSLKQQLIQELANQTVAQLTQSQNNDVAQLQAQYDSWVQEQEVASLQAQYDEWLKAQTPQEVPQAAPQVTPQVTPQVQAPIAEKPSAPKRSLRLEQEEAKMLAKEAQQRQNDLRDTSDLRRKRDGITQIIPGEGIANPSTSVNQLPSIADYQKQIQQASEKEREAKEIEDRIANLDNYVQPVTNQTDSLKETAQNVELANKWLDPNYQFTKDEGQKAYDVAIKELQKLDGIRPADMTDEEKARYDAFKDLEVKSNRLNAFAVGAADEAIKMGKGINTIQKYAPVAGALYNISDGINAVLPNANIPNLQESIDKGLSNLKNDKVTELAKGAAPIVEDVPDQVFDYAKLVNKALKYIPGYNTLYNIPYIGQKLEDAVDAKLTNLKDGTTPISSYGTGEMATQIGAYMATNPYFDALGEAIGGGSKLAQFLGNQVGQNVQDVFLDLIPQYKELKEQGLSDKEIWPIILKAGGMDALGNLGMGFLSEIPGIIKNLDNGAPKQAAKEVADNSAFFKRAMGEEVIDTGDEVVDNAIKQQKAAAEEIERLAKQTPEVPESEVKNLVEDAIPENVEVDPENVVYHSGKLSRLNKAETRGMMSDSKRNTGYYGTGHYFVDGAHKFELDDNKRYFGKPYSSVDISKYDNLYKATTDSQAYDLHNFSEDYTRYVNGGSDKYFVTKDGVDEAAKKEYLDNLYERFRGLFPEQNMSEEDFINRIDDFRRSEKNNDLGNLDDSVFTQFMKEMGYNGVDTRGTNYADTGYGTVIYDLDEDSILQSNVTADDVKKGLMNTKVRRDGESLFDAEEDAKIQKILDDRRKRDRIVDEYNKNFDESTLEKAQENVSNLKEKIRRYEEDAKYEYKQMLSDEKYLDKQIRDTISEYEDFGIDYNYEEIRDFTLDHAKERLEQIDGDIEELNRQLAEAQSVLEEQERLSEEAYKQAKQTVEGADPLQTFGEGKPEGDWKTSKLRTNTLENQGWGDELPKKDYAYRVWHTAEQHKAAKERGQSFEDLLFKDRYDAADVKAVMSEIHSKMDSGDVKKANRLAQQLFSEEKANAQALQALAEYNHNTIEGALADAAKVQDDILTPWKTQNTKTHDGNSRIARALADMGHKADPTVKTKLTHDQIKKGIVAELEREFGSIDKYFNEEDIEFLANLAEDKSIPLWQITDEIEHKLKHGTWYPIEKEVQEKFVGNSRLASILKSIGDDTKPETKAPLSHAEIKEGITNELKREFADMEAQFNDNDIEFLTRLVEDKSIKNWQIADEISYKLEHGDWYSLDESLPEKTVKNKQVSQMLNNILNGKNNAKPAKEMTIGELLTGIKNSLNDEPLSVSKQFTDDDYYFIAQMMQNDVPKWQIEDELAHRIQHGEWYTLDESTKVAKPTNRKLQQALDSLVNEEIRAEKTAPSLKQIREEVRNTLEKELAGSEFSKFTDDDIDYLANLIHEGARSEEIARALDMRAATGSWGVSDKTLQEVNNIFKRISQFDENSKEFVEGQAEAYKLLAEELVPNASFFEKLATWRYLAMLGNPKTMLRNLIGNVLFNGVTSFSNTIAALAEAGIDKTIRKFGGEGIQRTKSVLNPFKDSDLIKASAIDADASRYRQIIGSKYEKMDKDALRQARSVFDSKAAQGFEKVTDKGISDYFAVKAKYATSLAGYLKANGLDKSIFDVEVELDRLKKLSKERLLTDAEKATMDNLQQEVKRLDKARDYALKQAEYATFHENNKISSVLSKWSRTSREKGTGLGSLLIEATVPFKKTPANVLRSGVEYSPLGAIDSIRRTGKLIYENTGKRAGNLADVYKASNAGEFVLGGLNKEIEKSTASDVIESWSKTLTGTGMAALGYYLYNKGILHSSDPDTKYQDQLEGHQNYALEMNNKSYTIDWAAPAAMSLLLGAELAKLWPSTGKDTEDFYDNADKYFTAANKIADPLVETSMLQGVQNTLESAADFAKNNDDKAGMLVGAGYTGLLNYGSQAIPTIGGQIARTIDPYRRSTYTDKEGISATIDKQNKKMMNKIPGLSMFNEKYTNTYGEEQKNSPFNNPVGNLAYQMFSPGYLSDINETDADKMSRDAYNTSKNTNALPELKSSFKDSEGNRVSPQDYTKGTVAMGKANKEIRDAFANDEWFNSLDKTKQEEIVKSFNTIAEHAGNAAIDPNYETASAGYNAYKEGGVEGLLDYHKEESYKDKLKELSGGNVKTNSNAGEAALELIREGKYDEAKKVCDDYQKYKEIIDEYDIKTGTFISSDSAKKVQELIEAGKPEEAEEYAKQISAVTSNGLGADSGMKHYDRAKKYIPGLEADQFAKTYSKIDVNSDGVSQGELIAYINSHAKSDSEAQKLWKAYGQDWTNKKGQIKRLVGTVGNYSSQF